MIIPMDLKDRVAALEKRLGRAPQAIVDYSAWERGYMPPSEHILIDQLAYRGARVVSATDFGTNGAVWIVTRDLKTLRPAARKALRDLIDMVFDDLLPETNEQLGTGSESAPGLAQCDTSSPARESSEEPSPTSVAKTGGYEQ